MLNAASTSPDRDPRLSSMRRPARVVAVIAPPMRMPRTGTTAIGVTGISPLPNNPAPTGTLLAHTGGAAQYQRPPAVRRRPAVAEATISIRPTNAAVSHHACSTVVIARPTTSS